MIPLALFKEMICYLRVLLESDLTGHHEIAVAALYRLYYASSERLDPLPRLLSAWKSGECYYIYSCFLYVCAFVSGVSV